MIHTRFRFTHPDMRAMVEMALATRNPECPCLSGHKTGSIYKRYDIGSERGANETGKCLREHWRRLGEQEAQNRAKPAKPDKLGDDVQAAAAAKKQRADP